MATLTASALRALKPKTKAYDVSAGTNLIMRVQVSGTKSFLFKYRDPITGKRKNKTLGKFPTLSLADARAMCGKLTLELANDEPDAILSDKTLSQLSKEWLNVKASRVTERQVFDISQSLKNYILPTLGEWRVVDIKPLHIIALLKPLEAQGKLETVRRICSRIGQLFDFALGQGIVDANVFRGLSSQFRTPKKSHLPALSPQQLPELINQLNDANVSLIVRALIKFQLATLTRPAEASNATWDEMDLDNRIWTIPAERMKSRRAHQVPLTNYTVQILKRLKDLGTGSDYVFPAPRDLDKPVNSQTANACLKRIFGQGITTAHGLRALGSTLLNECGLFRPDVIEACLAHTDQDTVRSAYNRAQYLTERREALEWLSTQIELREIGTIRI